MILQSLCAYYDSLCALPGSNISRPGWSSAKVTFALCLDTSGALANLMPLQKTDNSGKKPVERPKILTVPQQEGRSSGVKANFLCDNAGYLLGVDGKGKPQRTAECFAAAKALHHSVLDGIEDAGAHAILTFLDTWQPEQAEQNELLKPYWKQLMAGGMLVFRVGDEYAHELPAIRAAWQKRCAAGSGNETGLCLVTGKTGPIARTHTPIKGVHKAQTSGAALVSFNGPAFESYGKTQGDNAPVGEAAMFAYTTALNYLLADGKHTFFLSDTTVVCWAKTAQTAYQDLFGWALNGGATIDDDTLFAIMKQMRKGICYERGDFTVDPDTEFCILGLAPNAARLSVRFFYRNRFGALIENLERHQERLAIVRPAGDQTVCLAISQLLQETANLKSQDKAAPPLLAGAMIRAVLNDTPYPEQLRQKVMLRIRADGKITRTRAAILKAFLLKKAERSAGQAEYKEVCTVKLNDQSDYLPYLLGRCFAVLEYIQKTASQGINTTIKDRYFNSACATPGVVFPTLIKLHNSHLKVLMREKPGYGVKLEKEFCALTARIGENYPKRLSLDEQGAFILGYYHQTQAFYTKKEDMKDE